MTDLGAQRVAMNNNAFRAANERIQGFVRNLDAPAQIPFICECAAEGCTQIVMLTLDEYEGVRTDPAHFLCVPGHEEADEPWGKVVDNRPASVIVEKVGEAAEVAKELSKRPGKPEDTAGDGEPRSGDSRRTA